MGFSFQNQKINYIISRDKSKTKLVHYLLGCAFSPAIATFQISMNYRQFKLKNNWYTFGYGIGPSGPRKNKIITN